MMSLVPRDSWDYRLSDLCRSVKAASGARELERGLDIPGIGRSIPVRSGRAGLVAAIRAIGLKAGAGVGVPLYCCPVVFEAVAAAGCVPRFVDVDPATFCASPEDVAQKRSRIDALVAVHMFGNMCDISKLAKAAPNVPIIEDCAQALGSKEGGRPAGLFGHIAFFSFRSGKYVSAGEGGALYSGDPETFARAVRIVAAMPAPSRGNEYAHGAKIFVKSMLRTRPLYGLIGHRLWSLYNKRTGDSENEAVVRGQIYLGDLRTAEIRLPSIDGQIRKQRAIAEYYSTNLKVGPGVICPERPGGYYNRYLYPLTLASSGRRDHLAAYLLRRQVDTMTYLDHVVETAAARHGYRGDCPMAERLSKRVLVIPGYHRLTEKTVQRIARLVNDGWAEMESRGIG